MYIPVVIRFATKGMIWRGGRTLAPRTKTQPPTNIATTAHKKRPSQIVKALPKLVSLPYARGGLEGWSNTHSPHENATTDQRRNHCAQKKDPHKCEGLTQISKPPLRKGRFGGVVEHSLPARNPQPTQLHKDIKTKRPPPLGLALISKPPLRKGRFGGVVERSRPARNPQPT